MKRKLLVRNDYPDVEYAEYFIREEDREDAIVQHIETVRRDKETGETKVGKLQRKTQKFVCAGGPCNGERRTEEVGRRAGYFLFNRSAEGAWDAKSRKFLGDVPTAVLVYMKLWQK
jgi:hypothetical protein